jgi:hypothetical protein
MAGRPPDAWLAKTPADWPDARMRAAHRPLSTSFPSPSRGSDRRRPQVDWDLANRIVAAREAA